MYRWGVGSKRVRAAIERIQAHFLRARISGPVSEATLAALDATITDVPDGLRQFFLHCDGFDAGLHDEVVGKVFGATETIASLRIWSNDGLMPGLAPVRGDGCGNYDCVVLGDLGRGAVVFWDHEQSDSPSHLLAGSMEAYTELLAKQLTTVYNPDGERLPEYALKRISKRPWVVAEKRHPWPFDQTWLRAHDPSAATLLDSPAFAAWLCG